MENEKMARMAALAAAGFLQRALGPALRTDVGIVLGTGWGSQLRLVNERSVSFKDVPGFDGLGEFAGHERKFVAGECGGKAVIALSGRVHLNEHPTDPSIPQMVRLQIQTLMELGVRVLILTNAAGALPRTDISVGSLVVVEAFSTLFAPPMPLFAGEFCSPEDTLSQRLVNTATSLSVRGNYPGGFVSESCYAMVRGPFFEGRKADKQALRNMGAHVVGMSTLPEACIAALYKAEVLALSFVTNDSEEVHSHEENLARATAASAGLSTFLERLITAL